MKNVFLILGVLFFSSVGLAKSGAPLLVGKASAEEVAWCKSQAKSYYNKIEKKGWVFMNTSASLDSKDPSVVIATVQYDPSPCGVNQPANVVACYSFGQRLEVYCKKGQVLDIVD